MMIALNDILKKKSLNEWRLFWLIFTPISFIMIVAMLRIPQWDGPAVSSMIQLSVRWSVPWLFLAFAASSLQLLYPAALTRWLLRNRKIIGLCFAAAMAWQLFFIMWLVTVHRDYYITEVYVLRDAIEGVTGYLFLIAMTLTSFRFGRQQLSPRSWRWLHKGGIYFLWAYAYTVYWWNIFYYSNPVALDYVYYWAGFTACALRALAWRKKRLMKVERGSTPVVIPPVFRLTGLALVASGIIVAVITPLWRQFSEQLLTGYALTSIPEKFIPYWPFEPFIPLFIIAVGCFISSWTVSNQPEPLGVDQRAG